MQKEAISQKQGIILYVCFVMSRVLIIGVNQKAGRDTWIALIIAIAMAVVIYLVYSRILILFPDKGLYEIVDIVFGRILGRLLILLYVWYAFHLALLVTRNISEFVRITALGQTPQAVLDIAIPLLAVFAVRGGIELIGRFASIFLPLLILLFVLIVPFFLPTYEIENLKPVLYNGMKPVFSGAFSIFVLQFCEPVLFLTVLGNLRTGSSPYKAYLSGLLIASPFIVIIALGPILSYEIPNIEIQYFIPYYTVQLIEIGDFLQRIEGSITIVFIIMGLIKTCVCLYAASAGLAKVFNLTDYHRISAPLALFAGIASIVIFNNATEVFQWNENIYPYYAFPFGAILPILIWIAAEVKARVLKKREQPPDDICA